MAQPEEVKYSHIQVSKFLGFQPLSPGLPSLGFSPIWPAPQRRSVDSSHLPLLLNALSVWLRVHLNSPSKFSTNGKAVLLNSSSVFCEAKYRGGGVAGGV